MVAFTIGEFWGHPLYYHLHMPYYYHILIIKGSFHLPSFCQRAFFQGVIFLTVLFSGGFLPRGAYFRKSGHTLLHESSVSAGFFRAGEAFEITALR